MAERLIFYSGYYDGPLGFVVSHEGIQYIFLRGHFDEALDDFPNIYEVYTLPEVSEEDIGRVWKDLLAKNKVYFGSIHLHKVIFDPTKRKFIDTETFSMISRGVSES